MQNLRRLIRVATCCLLIGVCLSAADSKSDTLDDKTGNTPATEVGPTNYLGLSGDIASIVGCILSLISLLMTIWVLRRIGNIKASFSTQALLPAYRTKLGGSIKNLEQYQKDKNSLKIKEELTVCKSNLIDLSAHLDSDRAKQVASVISIIEQALELRSDQDVWGQSGSVVRELMGVKERIGNLIKKNQWGGRDGN